MGRFDMNAKRSVFVSLVLGSVVTVALLSALRAPASAAAPLLVEEPKGLLVQALDFSTSTDERARENMITRTLEVAAEVLPQYEVGACVYGNGATCSGFYTNTVGLESWLRSNSVPGDATNFCALCNELVGTDGAGGTFYSRDPTHVLNWTLVLYSDGCPSGSSCSEGEADQRMRTLREEHGIYVIGVEALGEPCNFLAAWSDVVLPWQLPLPPAGEVADEILSPVTLTVWIYNPWCGWVNKDPWPPYRRWDVVTLTAFSNAGCYFSYWYGDLTSTDNLATITLDADKNIDAVFLPDEYSLEIRLVGNGTVVWDPNQPTYFYGDVVALTAVPAPGWFFSGWSGDLTGSANPASLLMDGPKVVTATFGTHRICLPVIGKGPTNTPPEINIAGGPWRLHDDGHEVYRVEVWFHDIETPRDLHLTAESDNLTLIEPRGFFWVEVVSYYGVLYITTIEDGVGTAVVTVTVQDPGGLTDNVQFTLTVE